MGECINKYFIYNNEIKNSNEFDEKILSEGKSLYEVIRIIDGKPLFLQKHLKRLENSAAVTNMDLWITIDELKEKITELIKVNDTAIGNVKFIFNFNKDNTFAAYFVKHHYPSTEDYEKGVRTILYHGERKNPNAKVINMGFREAVDKEIREKEAYEAILVDNKGYITEGSKSNIFMIKGDKVITSPLEDVLPGITRNVIIEKCKDIGFEVAEEKIHYEVLKDLDGLFISGTSPKVLPIREVDNMKFDSAKNEVILKIMRGYNILVDEDITNS
ncbi:aminotransferase class IV [Clostridium sp. A1-XYC3]|uniref:Aminotransferase class IV n=1 Tax=Clostridium tanneri TaxID=3037988 RepID=A0ABU4JNK0_9CLOT|nr:aminotransferase class IV [Clostridium sp. A1-XYC3]MDW8799721.1 aminotransferase class IV [Clostridium sp. A1-XYC3]